MVPEKISTAATFFTAESQLKKYQNNAKNSKFTCQGCAQFALAGGTKRRGHQLCRSILKVAVKRVYLFAKARSLNISGANGYRGAVRPCSSVKWGQHLMGYFVPSLVFELVIFDFFPINLRLITFFSGFLMSIKIFELILS